MADPDNSYKGIFLDQSHIFVRGHDSAIVGVEPWSPAVWFGGEESLSAVYISFTGKHGLGSQTLLTSCNVLYSLRRFVAAY